MLHPSFAKHLLYWLEARKHFGYITQLTLYLKSYVDLWRIFYTFYNFCIYFISSQRIYTSFSELASWYTINLVYSFYFCWKQHIYHFHFLFVRNIYIFQNNYHKPVAFANWKLNLMIYAQRTKSFKKWQLNFTASMNVINSVVK